MMILLLEALSTAAVRPSVLLSVCRLAL